MVASGKKQKINSDVTLNILHKVRNVSWVPQCLCVQRGTWKHWSWIYNTIISICRIPSQTDLNSGQKKKFFVRQFLLFLQFHTVPNDVYFGYCTVTLHEQLNCACVWSNASLYICTHNLCEQNVFVVDLKQEQSENKFCNQQSDEMAFRRKNETTYGYHKRFFLSHFIFQ